jgi:ATP-dependent Clp protease ATP-binding subunit ClpB
LINLVRRCIISNDPVEKYNLMETKRERVLTMADKLRERVVGQDEALEIVTDAIQRSRADMNDAESK